MSLLILDKLKKHYGAQEVLSGAELRIDPGEKVGLVGRNGGGKTTLLRLIEGVEAPDWGSVRIRKGCDLGYVPQRPEFAAGLTVRAHVESGLEHLREMLHRYEELGHQMGEAQDEQLDKLLAEHAGLGERIEVLGGWEVERRVETVLSGIGLPEEFWEREARTLSGGEKSRTALARALAAGHDLLLLDEPTNHLDLEGIEWIEEYIKTLPGAVLVVSHDRRLLDNAVSAIVELGRGKLTRYPGNYTNYVRLQEEQYESAMRAYEQQQDFIRKEQAFIKKHMGSQRTAEAKGRQKKLSNVERIEQPYHDVRKPHIRPPEAARGGEMVLRTENLAAGYADNLLFEGVELRIGRGHRIGIVGKNGAGKSTLLKILAGKRAPQAGHVEYGHAASCGYYDQEMADLKAETPFHEIRRMRPSMSDLEIRSHLALFLFRGENETDKAISSLSGGERARLALAKLVLENPSWLAMDEPTNHLDLAGRTALEEMLSGYQGALVCISHDRAFLDDLCDFIFEVDGGSVVEYQGNYSAWRAAKLGESADAKAAKEKASAQRKQEERKRREAEEKQQAKQKANASASKPAANKPKNPFKFKQLEDRIMALEEQISGLNESLTKEEVYTDAEKVRDAQYRIAELERELEAANAEWESWLS
ncbi:MAG: ABC-F family ATP-binding cassette domain-containing protein [Planctomycetes bacterium]|nr:ABC-F family ATP-binding cassette domain-containing protein [Planctomycetota bacterium]